MNAPTPMPQRFTRILVLVNKQDSWERVAQVVAQADKLAASTPALAGQYQLVSSRDDYEARAPVAGSWDAWCQEVGTGIDPQTRKHHYDWYVVTGNGVMGRANYLIVAGALRRGAPVFWLRDEGGPAVVKACERAGGNAFKGSHRVVV